MDYSTPVSSVLHYLPEFAQFLSVESVMLYNHLILCHPPLLLLSAFPSIIVFSNVLALFIKWPKYWSFSFSNSPSNEYSGLISFQIDWFDLLAVQGTLKESSPAPQLESINSSMLSLLYDSTLTSHMTTGKTMALTIWTFVGKLISLLFNTLSRFLIAFLPILKYCFYFFNKVFSPILALLQNMPSSPTPVYLGIMARGHQDSNPSSASS